MWHPPCFPHLLLRMFLHMDGCWKWYFYDIACYLSSFSLSYCSASALSIEEHSLVCMSRPNRYILLLCETKSHVAQAGPDFMVLLPKPLEYWDDRHASVTNIGFTLFSFFQIFVTLYQVVFIKTTLRHRVWQQIWGNHQIPEIMGQASTGLSQWAAPLHGATCGHMVDTGLALTSVFCRYVLEIFHFWTWDHLSAIYFRLHALLVQCWDWRGVTTSDT